MTKRILSENVPAVLRALPRWIPWVLERDELKGGPPRKRPLGSTRNPDFPKPLDEVQPPEEEGGLGFITTGKIPLPDGRWAVCLDVDACRDPETGALAAWANEAWQHYGRSYCEITPSGAGLHLWLSVAEEPKTFPKIRVAAQPLPEGSTKTTEFQGFGCGSAGYVTMTGRPLPGSLTTLFEVDSLQWLLDRYHVLEQDDVDVQLPTGSGLPPEIKTVVERVEKAPNGQTLLDGKWEDLDRFPSASEAWLELSRHTLAAANGHADVAAQVLLQSAWGLGDVDSFDPDKYTSERWVKRDLARIASKLTHSGAMTERTAEEVFEPVEVTETTAAPEVIPVESAGEYVRNRDRVNFFLVEDLLPRVGVVQLYGDPGTGKTPVALSLAVAVSQGHDTWLGEDVDNPGAVFYFVGEDSVGLANRLVAQLGREPDDTDGIYLSTRPGRLSDAEDVKKWFEWIETKLKQNGEQRALSLIVVDTQNRNFGPGSENNTEDATTFITHVEALARRFQCCVLMTHHKSHQNKDRGRGSTVFEGGIDASFDIERVGRLGVLLKKGKAKNWGDQGTYKGQLEVCVVGEHTKKNGETREVTAVAFRDTGVTPDQVFDDTGRDPNLEILTVVYAARMDDDRDHVQIRELAHVTGKSRSTLHRHLRTLETMELLTHEKLGRNTAYQITELGIETVEKATRKATESGETPELGEIDELLS